MSPLWLNFSLFLLDQFCKQEAQLGQMMYKGKNNDVGLRTIWNVSLGSITDIGQTQTCTNPCKIHMQNLVKAMQNYRN